MRLDISEILREVGKHLPYEINEPPLVDEHVECTKPIDGQIVFTNAGGTLIVRGKAETRVALPCSRCEKYFEQDVKFAVEESFELKHKPAGPRTLATVAIVEEDESPIAGKLFEGYVFNLTEMLRQYILLDEPSRPMPPTLPDGKCAQCHLLPEEVLGSIVEAQDLTKPAVNPALAKLGELLQGENDA